jgi:hypothetical protein
MTIKTISLLNENDSMVPPWEKFPTYERYTIGWRMGYGEEYSYDWYKFINNLSNDYETRLNYLLSHRPAPLNWCDRVFWVLYPDIESKPEFESSSVETLKLVNLGLIEHDVAYNTWLKQQPNLGFSWLVMETPEDEARYNLREFWFFSRQLNDARKHGNLNIENVPISWQKVETQLLTGHLGDINPTHGLLTLAQMLCAGSVQPPWELGLSVDDFADSFEMDMGYTDAFHLWIMSAFDDDKLLRNMLQIKGIPNDWTDWINTNSEFYF